MITVLIIGIVVIGIIVYMQWKKIFPFGVRNEDMIDPELVEEEGLFQKLKEEEGW